MTALDMLQHCPDVATLKPELHKLCEKFGHVTRLEVLTAIHEGAKQAICFIRLDSPEKEQNLMQALGVGRFGGEIVFVVDINQVKQSGIPGPSSQWADLKDFEDARLQGGMGNARRDCLEPRSPLGSA